MGAPFIGKVSCVSTDNMGDEDEDHDFATGDSGAAHVYPLAAGEIRKGSYLMIKGHPCKCSEVSTSKTGKHGHEKRILSPSTFSRPRNMKTFAHAPTILRSPLSC